MAEVAVERADLTCPSCGTVSDEVMPTNACQFFWTCPHCHVRHRPEEGDCCVFCSYGTRPCPSAEPALPSACMDPDVLKELQGIPGVGKRVSADLWHLGIREVADLRGQDPEALYTRLCKLQGRNVDRCMLRCAVYFASVTDPKPELLKWWNWKDR